MSTETNATVNQEANVPPTPDAGVTSPPAVDDAAIAAAAENMGVDGDTVKEFMESDPEFAKHVESMSANKDKGGEGHSPGKAPEASSTAGSEEPKPKADDKDSGDKGTSDDFVDDVIKGLKGSEFAKLSNEAQNALAEYHEGFLAKVRAAEEAEARVKALMSDPVISSRAAALESGVDVGNGRMGEKEKNFILGKIREALGGEEYFDAAEAEAVWRSLGEGLEAVAMDMANASIVGQDLSRKAAETVRKGNELMLGLGQFNSALAVKETDITKFYNVVGGKLTLNEAHPEHETFKNGIGKIVDWAANQGIGYDRALAMGDKVFYAAAAAALDMPVAMNTGARDQKIAADARKKALEPFLKTSKSNTLDVSGVSGAGATKREEAARTVQDGADLERLVTDADYYKSHADRCWNDPGKMERLEALVEKGRQLIANKKRR